MRRLLSMAAFLAITAPVLRADEKSDAARLNGTYQVVDFLVGGKSDDEKKKSGAVAVIKDGTIEIREGERKAEAAKFTLDATKKPPQIDIMPGRGNNKVVPGIYEFKATDKGTELTIAFARGGSTERPKNFKGEGENEIVIKLFRKKDK